MSTGDRRQGAEIHLHPTTPPMLVEMSIVCLEGKSGILTGLCQPPPETLPLRIN